MTTQRNAQGGRPEYRRAVEDKRAGRRIDPEGLTLQELVEAHVEAWGGPVGDGYLASPVEDFIQAAAVTLEAEAAAGGSVAFALDDSVDRLIAAAIAHRIAGGEDPREVVNGIVRAAQDAERDCRAPEREAA